MGVLTLEKSRKKFSKLAWLSACLSLLIGLSHVRSFPSYNLALSLIALYASVQEVTDTLLKSITVCAIMGMLSIVADIMFYSLWAREIIDGYSGVLRFCLVLFIMHMFVKIALLYSAMAVAVTATSSKDDKKDRSEAGSPRRLGSKSLDLDHEKRQLHGGSFKSAVGDHGIDIPSSPQTPDVAGLVSPGGYDSHTSYSP